MIRKLLSLCHLPKTSLRYKILSIFILAVVLPALLSGIVLTSLSRGTIRSSIFFGQQELVSRLADRINAQVDRHIEVLLLYSTIGSLPRPKQIDAGREMLKPKDRIFFEIALLDAKGNELWKLRRTGLDKKLINRSRRSEYQIAYSGRLFISQVLFNEERHPYVVAAVPLSNRAGVLVAKLDLTQMWQWISEVQIGETGYAFIVDRKGNLIAHPETERVLAHSNFASLPIVKDFLERKGPKDRWAQYRDEQGREVVGLYQELSPRLGWAVVTQIPYDEVYKPVSRMSRSIVLWTIFWTIVFLFVGYRLVEHIIEPLSLLQSGAQQISQGKLDIKLDIATGDEIEALSKNFEKMAEALKQLEQVRQDLTRMIIHDLKSPLSGIMGSLDYLESGLLGEITADQQKIVSLAKKSSESLLVMIQNLLDVAKMEEGKLELRKETFDIAQMLTERKHQYDPMVANENKSITLDIEPAKLEISAERHLVERVLNNLISNAVNHTTGGGKIVLALRRLERFVEVRISDNGSGIPPEYREKIFEKFVQVQRKQAQLRTGAGLGLTFCKMVVETHGGVIRVESELNKGSSFIFTLPVV